MTQTDQQRIANLERALEYAALVINLYEQPFGAHSNYQHNAIQSLGKIANGQTAPAIGFSWSLCVGGQGSVRMGN